MIEIIFEILSDLIIEGSIEIGKNKKIPNIIRYPLIILIIAFFLIVTIGLIVLGIIIANKDLIIGFILIFLGVMFLILSILKFRVSFLAKK